tara:strand:- start:104 stop:478 length:375 start_codon:yes stop_codon:yes gene_type:complete
MFAGNYDDLPKNLKNVLNYQIIKDDVYKYPINIVNKLKYKPDNIVSEKYFCELTKNNWLKLKDTPKATYGFVGNKVIHIDDTHSFPIEKEKIFMIIYKKDDTIQLNNNLFINPEDYLIFKGFKK